VDSKRLEDAVRWVERQQAAGGLDVVSPRSDYPVQADDPRNLIEITLENEDLAQENAENINLIIQQAFKTAPSGETWQFSLQGPVLRIHETPLVFDDMAGMEVLLAGANLGNGDTPDATSWYNKSTITSNFFYGFELFGSGYGSAAMVELDDVTCFRWRGGSLRHDGADPAAYGIRIGKGSAAGSGPSCGTIYVEQLGFQNMDVGVDIGRVTSTSGGYQTTNCSETVWMQPIFGNVDDCFESKHGQAVNHVVIQPQCGEGDGALWKITGGGNVLLLQPTTYNQGSIFELVGGGSNTGTLIAIGTRIDGTSKQTKLWDATAGQFNVGGFYGVCVVDSASPPAGSRITIYNQQYVLVELAHNLNRPGESKPIFESGASGGKCVWLRCSRVLSESNGSADLADNIGTWHSTGDWVFRDCIDNTNYTRVADEEFPRRNGQCSTHIYKVETDFDNIGDGLRSFAVSASGTGAGSDSVFPWDVYTVGVISLNTGTDTNGSSAAITHTEAMAVTGGPWKMDVRARLITLSVITGGNPDPGGVAAPYNGSTTGGTVGGVVADASGADETFTVRIGFCDSATGNGTDGIFWRYSLSNGGRWECVTRDGGSETATDSGILLTNAVAAGDQDAHNFEIRINAAGTSVKFYLDGTLAATNTTNIPDATDYMGLMPGQIVKSAGTNSRSMHIDYAYYRFIPSTARGSTFNK
jgi:hypothetical protein